VLSPSACGTDLNESRAFSANAETAIIKVVQRHANARVLDPKGFLCDETYCPVVSDGISIYTDEEHLSRTYSYSIADRLGPDVDWLLSGPVAH
jgi:hypothetical protein